MPSLAGLAVNRKIKKPFEFLFVLRQSINGHETGAEKVVHIMDRVGYIVCPIHQFSFRTPLVLQRVWELNPVKFLYFAFVYSPFAVLGSAGLPYPRVL